VRVMAHFRPAEIGGGSGAGVVMRGRPASRLGQESRGIRRGAAKSR
jgi:hypothetical protein